MITDWTARRLDIWHQMTPQQRDYDRLVAHSYPPSDGALETEAARQAQFDSEQEAEGAGCRCHIAPPCSACANGTSDDDA